MLKSQFGIFAVTLLLLGLTVAAQTIERAPDGDAPALRSDKSLINDLQATMGQEAVQVGDKWIGVLCREVDDALRAHLDIPENAGLMVDEVIDDSPAAATGLARFDILIKVNGEPLRATTQLVDQVSAADEDGIRLIWLRKGQRMEAVVHPADRPQEMRGPIWPEAGQPNNQNLDRLRKFFEKAQAGQNQDQDGDLQFRFWGPEFRMKQFGQQQFPSNLSIQITREGNEPAAIKVERGNDSWELTENDLDQLPDDVRPHVEKVLGGGNVQFFGRGLPGEFGRFFDETQWPRMNKQFEKLQEGMDKMMDELQELREQQPRIPLDDEDTIDA